MKETNIYESLHFSDENIVMEILLETAFCRELRLAMRAHQMMRDHECDHPVGIEVCYGAVMLSTTEGQRSLAQGSVAVLEGGEKHHLEALEESVVRLTVFIGPRVEERT